MVLSEAQELLEGLPAVRGGPCVAGLRHTLLGEGDLCTRGVAKGEEKQALGGGALLLSPALGTSGVCVHEGASLVRD